MGATLLTTLPAEKDRIIVPGPAGFMPPSAAQLGVSLPKDSIGIAYGHHVPEDVVIDEIAAQMPNVLIIPMPDYRPKYPKVDPEEVINPNHPNLTIWGNKIEACIFVGVHCHYANLTLKMIRAGTNCCTAALCAEQGHEDAMLSVHDMDAAKLRKVAQIFKRVREQMGMKLPPDGKNVRYTGLQSR